jgi:ribosomal protein L24E
MTHLQKDNATKTNHCLHLYCLSCVLPGHDLEHTNMFLRIHNQILVFQKAKSQKMFEKNTKLLMHDKRAKVRRNEISNIIDYEKKV